MLRAHVKGSSKGEKKSEKTKKKKKKGKFLDAEHGGGGGYDLKSCPPIPGTQVPIEN